MIDRILSAAGHKHCGSGLALLPVFSPCVYYRERACHIIDAPSGSVRLPHIGRLVAHDSYPMYERLTLCPDTGAFCRR